MRQIIIQFNLLHGISPMGHHVKNFLVYCAREQINLTDKLVLWRKNNHRTWYSLKLNESSVLCTMTSELSEMVKSDIKDQNLVDEYSKAKKQNAQTCLSSPFTFRLWQILVFLFIVAIIITVVGIVVARFGPRSKCPNSNKTSGVLSTTKQNGGNQTFLPFRYLRYLVLYSTRFSRSGICKGFYTFLVLTVWVTITASPASVCQ